MAEPSAALQGAKGQAGQASEKVLKAKGEVDVVEPRLDLKKP